MKKIRIGILGASEIAYRRFMPAIIKDDRFEYVGVAYYRKEDEEKVKFFKKDFGGEIFFGFDKILNDPNIDAVYVPQPPALHYQFGKDVLSYRKHLFMEKPFTISEEHSLELIELAKNNNLAVAENYMFRFHKQINTFVALCKDGIVGNIDHYEVRFCFPKRAANDFRYIKDLGGGALLDCGGYTIMLSNILIGGDGVIKPNKAVFEEGIEVDMHGSGELISASTGIKSLFYFGMNDEYSCSAKAFGSKGVLVASRVLTAPVGFDVKFDLLDNDGNLVKQILVGEDDSFAKSISNFYDCIKDDVIRNENYAKILEQAHYIEIMMKEGF